MKNNNKGFTLIELIMVTIILGILAAVAVPRYMGTVNRAEAAAEDAVLEALEANAEAFAVEQFMDTGRKSYPSNPFDGADVDGYVGEFSGSLAELQSGEWTFFNMETEGFIIHKRNDDSVFDWYYSSNDDNSNQADDRGSFGERRQVASVNGDDFLYDDGIRRP